MKPSEIVAIKCLVENLGDLDLARRIGEANPDVDLNQLRILDYTAVEIISLSNRLISQFLDEIESPNTRFWQPTFQWETSYQDAASRPLAQVLQQLNDYVTQGNWEGTAQFLDLAIGFQIIQGFWDRSTARNRNTAKIKYHSIIDDLESKGTQITILLEQVRTLKEEQEKSNALKQQEAVATAAELESAKRQVAEINVILQNASGTNGQLTSLLSSQKTNFDITATELAHIEKQKTEVGILIEDLDKKLKGAGERLTHMEEKENWVNELAGTAAAGALGHKFESRRKQLATASVWWLGGTVASIVLAAVWLGLSHKYFVNHADDVWKTLALNFGLLLPAIFIVGFFAKQFSRVRQFEEEYAFRSAVAMTLGAFADRLKKDDAGYNKLILETVESLYKMPVLLHEKEFSGGLFRQNSPEKILKAATGFVREMKTLS